VSIVPEESRDGDASAVDRALSTPESTAELQPKVNCWRCGKASAAGSECEWCGATLVSQPTRAAATEAAPPLLKFIRAYAILLIFSAVVGVATWIIHVVQGSRSESHTQTLFEFTAAELVIVVIWTIVIFAAGRSVPRPPPLPERTGRVRAAMWLAALPLMGVLLALNFGYHWLLETYIEFSWFGEPPRIEPPTQAAILFAFVSVCVQPGVMEELFFRYLGLGTLRGIMGDHAAVAVSSMIFGLAHIYAPLSIPILMVVGLGLGYVRLYSGSLLLPMLLHAFHNACVLWMEAREWAEI
jgi:membrane protease YdiL (CAAX protease family)